MDEPVWLEVDHVVDVHSEQLALFGGPAGIRDLGLLESALARPQHEHAYGEGDLANLAASYAFGIVRNHPFVDGNKRAGFAAMMIFLRLNGVHFTPAPVEATAAILALAAGEIEQGEIARWIRDNWPKQ